MYLAYIPILLPRRKYPPTVAHSGKPSGFGACLDRDKTFLHQVLKEGAQVILVVVDVFSDHPP